MKFKIGSRVEWVSNPSERGTVVEIGYNAIKVKWDDGAFGIYLFEFGAEGTIAQLRLIPSRVQA